MSKKELGDIGEEENTPEDLIAQQEVRELQVQAVENALNNAGRYDKKTTKKLKEVEKAINKAVLIDEETGEVVMDESGYPMFKASIEWKTFGGQIMAIWKCCEHLLNEGLVPQEEVEGVFELMFKLGEIHKDTNKEYFAMLPINYFVGSWHIMNLALRVGIYKEDTKLQKAIEDLATFFATRIDQYHNIVEKETIIDTNNELVEIANDMRARKGISEQVKRTISALQTVDGGRY